MLIIFMKSSDMLPRVDGDLAKVLFQIDDGDLDVTTYEWTWSLMTFFYCLFIGDTLEEFFDQIQWQRRGKNMLFNIDTDCYPGNVSNLCHSEPLLGYSSVIGFM